MIVTRFDANTGLFETILGKEDAIISDALNHASIIDGVRLCKAMRFRYANNLSNAFRTASEKVVPSVVMIQTTPQTHRSAIGNGPTPDAIPSTADVAAVQVRAFARAEDPGRNLRPAALEGARAELAATRIRRLRTTSAVSPE